MKRQRSSEPQKTLQEDAEALLAKVDDRERTGGRLAPEDRALIIRLAAKGTVTQPEIAKAVGCSQSTVSRVVSLLDTTAEAKVLLKSGAVKLAQTVVDTDDAAVALKALGKLDIVREDCEVERGNRVTVIVGAPGAPVRLPDLSTHSVATVNAPPDGNGDNEKPA